MTKESTTAALAFNEGCQARLDGEPAEYNPHQGDTLMYRYWKAGWRDVNLFWGRLAKARHCVQPLPPVTRGQP